MIGRLVSLLLCCTLMTAGLARAQAGEPQLLKRPPSATALPKASGQPFKAASWWSLGAGLVLLATLAGASAWQRRLRGGESLNQPLIQVLQRTSLGARGALYLVRVGQRQLLIGTGAQGAPALLLSEPMEPAESGGPA